MPALIVMCLLVGGSALLTPFVLAAPALAAPALAAPAVTAGPNSAVVLELVRREHFTDILLPSTEAEKTAVKAAYPEGRVSNGLNVLLIKRPDGVTLVDTGLPDTLPSLLEQLSAQGVPPEAVDQIIITHAHGDHIGGLTRDGKAVFPKARLVFSAKEHAFWSNPANRESAPARAARIFEQWGQSLAPYAGRVDAVDPANPLMEGVTLVPAYGHTPGHVGVLLSSPTTTLLFWGDLLHAAKVQVAHPAISATYDLEPRLAATSRKKVLDEARAGRWLVSGVHMPDAVAAPLP